MATILGTNIYPALQREGKGISGEVQASVNPMFRADESAAAVGKARPSAEASLSWAMFTSPDSGGACVRACSRRLAL